MNEVAELRPVERVTIDPDEIEALYRQFGRVGAEAAISMAMHDMSSGLIAAETAWRGGDLDALAAEARRIRGAARRLGIAKLVRLAGNTVALCAGADAVALGAATARMVRNGEAVLLAIWDFQGMRI